MGKYIAKYENQVNLLDWRKPKPEEVIKQKNEETTEEIKCAYNAVLKHFKENGDINHLEREIKSHWGLILVKNGIIIKLYFRRENYKLSKNVKIM